jgi:hypothetical protein
MFNTQLWYGDSADWFLRARERRVTMELLSDVLLYHRMHGNNFSALNVQASRNEFLQIVKVSLDRQRKELKVPAPYNFTQSVTIECTSELSRPFTAVQLGHVGGARSQANR